MIKPKISVIGLGYVGLPVSIAFDDEGKTVDANVSSSYKGGLLYKGKAKDYTSAADIIKKKSAKIIKIDIDKKKNKD